METRRREQNGCCCRSSKARELTAVLACGLLILNQLGRGAAQVRSSATYCCVIIRSHCTVTAMLRAICISASELARGREGAQHSALHSNTTTHVYFNPGRVKSTGRH